MGKVELSMEGTPLESTKEFYDLWLEDYEATFKKLLEMPAVGPLREKSEKMMRGFSNFSNLYASGMESNSHLQAVLTEAMRKTYEKAATEMEGELGPESYRDFYRIWVETYSSTFKEFFGSERFAADLGKFMSHSLDLQKYNQEMLEDNYLKPMNLPTKTEIDEINKELYSLKKKVKELTGQVRELTEKRKIHS